ncbi:unnamed protein product [Arctia plantaginis]|uniref:Uncharacterized protein n=1 Tax=Arctia plantaginis TaxID=874455 RepID=A0A8S1B4A8_ARCPL|nr:unnamed protein product [Arctia plantaginis]
MLVDELEGGSTRGGGALRPISLLELQAAIEAAAPPSPPPLREDSPSREESPPPEASSPRELSSPREPLAASTPLPTDAPEPISESAQRPIPEPVVVRRERKRRSNVKVDEIFNGNVNIVFGEDLMKKLKEVREFSIDERWISDVVRRRKVHILNERKRLIGELDDLGELDDARPPDKGETRPAPPHSPPRRAALTVCLAAGFVGWSGPEVAQAQATLDATAVRAADSDDDDGFFEQSSGGSSERGAELDPAQAARRRAQAEIAAWKASILSRAAAAEARGTFDVHELGARVLDALREARRRPRPALDLLREHAQQEADVSRLVLATLFLVSASAAAPTRRGARRVTVSSVSAGERWQRGDRARPAAVAGRVLAAPAVERPAALPPGGAGRRAAAAVTPPEGDGVAASAAALASARRRPLLNFIPDRFTFDSMRFDKELYDLLYPFWIEASW